MNILEDKWFIRVANNQEAVAVQEWAFSQGLAWGSKFEVRTDFDKWDGVGSSAAIGSGHFGGNCLGQASASYWERHNHKEIKVTFKFSVDTIVYPEVESPQQKQIKALEETIATATAQIQKLKEGI